jgi:SNF2 family DNA or RNA helicase
MGLGKTMQVLALLLVLRRQNGERRRTSVIVAPASLVANWESEVRRFAPSLRTFIAHPSVTPTAEIRRVDSDRLSGIDLVLTSYGTLVRTPALAKMNWEVAVLDEAQAIKNPGAKQTRAVKQLDARARIALTGTPVENRVGDLWSIFDWRPPTGSSVRVSCWPSSCVSSRSATIPHNGLGTERGQRPIAESWHACVRSRKSLPPGRKKALVFTQFREITAPLAAFLGSVFGRPGLVLHGETQVKKRHALVRQFQEDERVPFFVLSLKAGGSGLNLTAASHVIHFDRWWHPAVEDQATDRAFRIGQTKNVLVHKLLCRGTVEEKIDLLIESKRQLSQDLLEDGADTLLTEMTNEELLTMVALDLRAVSQE